MSSGRCSKCPDRNGERLLGLQCATIRLQNSRKQQMNPVGRHAYPREMRFAVQYTNRHSGSGFGLRQIGDNQARLRTAVKSTLHLRITVQRSFQHDGAANCA